MKMKTIAFSAAVIAGRAAVCAAAVTPGPLIQILPGDSQAVRLEKAANVIPTARQIAWQRDETIAFIHFGVNTFTGREWGDGREDPVIFNPTQLDANQWVLAFKSAGLKKVILTAKHHDGFVLYPSRYTEHSVKNSTRWRNGQGDVVRELAEACRRHGLTWGIYLSPADIHEHLPGGSFANGSPSVTTTIPTLVPGDNRSPGQFFTYSLDDYNRYFVNQLYELLTEYGPVHELWFDGAPAVSGQPFNRAAWFDVIHRLQPDAVIFHGDIRWNGNESGVSRESEWSVTPLPNDPRTIWSGDLTDQDLGSRAKVFESGMNWLYWYPAEADVSLHGGWFYHPGEGPKSLSHLMDIYYQSVGRNSVLLLNVPPDTRGLVIDQDVQRLAEFGTKVRQVFETNRARGASGTATSVRNNDPAFGADKAADDNHDTAWRAADGVTTATIEFTLPQPTAFSTVMLGESLAVGQRIESFAVDVWSNGAWQPVASGTTVGYKRLLKIAPVQSEGLRVRILQSRAAPSLANFGVFLDEGGTGGAPVQVFQHCNYDGWSASFTTTGNVSRAQIVSAGGVDNDASSIRVAPGYKVTLFDGDGQTGAWTVLTADNTCLVGAGFNDVLSSMRIEGPGGAGVVFFQHVNYGGEAGQALAPGSYTLADLQARGVPNDWASSARIPPGRTVTLYQHDNFQGTSWTLTGDTASLVTLSPNANDQLSSVRIQ